MTLTTSQTPPLPAAWRRPSAPLRPLAPASATAWLPDSQPPDVLFILADDLGYNEVNFNNASRGIRTPHLDALASAGVVLDSYNVQPICSPTRSALMTGRYPALLGTQANVIFWDTPWAVPLNHTFLPELLQDAGYQTALFGKWVSRANQPPPCEAASERIQLARLSTSACSSASSRRRRAAST